MAAIRVHLADDHTIFRDGLQAILASSEDVEVVGRSTTGEDAAAMIAQSKPDLVITQLDVDIKTAKEVLSGIRRASPGSKVMVLTAFDNLHYLKALARLGIDAYVHKSYSSEELLDTIGALSFREGGQNAVVSMPRALLERLDEEPAGGLSEREMEVLVLAARGLSNEEIARELSLALATVKRHLANVYQKVGVRSRSEAVRMALMEQWIGLGEIVEAARSNGSSSD
jgi:DNA-binding NarL/FixJ family response regulator